MRVLVGDLEGKALDYAAACAVEGKHLFDIFDSNKICGRSIKEMVSEGLINPSQNWAQGGKLIEVYRVDLTYESEGVWDGETCDEDGTNNHPYTGHYGSTPLVAAMRAIVQLEIGADFDVPEELL